MNRPAKIKNTVRYTLVPEGVILLSLWILIAIFGPHVWLVCVAVFFALFTLQRMRVARVRR